MKPSIICHRGFWKTKEAQNTLSSAEGAVKFGGMELDLKNDNGKIVLSHDPLKKGDSHTDLETVLKKIPDTFFAFDVKEDGLGPELKRLLSLYRIENYMTFDHSGPELQQYLRHGINAFGRFGDREGLPKQLSSLRGLVIDVFDLSNWNSVLNDLNSFTLQVPLFFISPELHAQEFETTWNLIRNFTSKYSHPTYICTDEFERAEKFFGSAL